MDGVRLQLTVLLFTSPLISVPGRTSNGCQFRWRRLSGSKLKSMKESGPAGDIFANGFVNPIIRKKDPSNCDASTNATKQWVSAPHASIRRLRMGSIVLPTVTEKAWTKEEDDLLRYSKKQDLRFDELSILLPVCIPYFHANTHRIGLSCKFLSDLPF